MIIDTSKILQLVESKSKGSMLDNDDKPKVGDEVWMLTGGISPFKPRKGKVTLVSNIDNRGLGNTYIDIKADDDKTYHGSIGQVFDHKPKQVKKTDQYGEVTVWE